MYIKLKVEGNLLKALKKDAEDSVRTCTQQAKYILKSYYKENHNSNNNTQYNILDKKIVSNSSNNKFEERENRNEEVESSDSDVEFIDDEILDF
ncbi:MAG: hypothetical protein ACLRLW_04605 [Terrisporobacter sp.]|uniref:hypothetical protein n=1 Tax=Terrisporobacter sp. TaxID=1965305 RepID=UPI0039A36C6C